MANERPTNRERIRQLENPKRPRTAKYLTDLLKIAASRPWEWAFIKPETPKYKEQAEIYRTAVLFRELRELIDLKGFKDGEYHLGNSVKGKITNEWVIVEREKANNDSIAVAYYATDGEPLGHDPYEVRLTDGAHTFNASTKTEETVNDCLTAAREILAIHESNHDLVI